MKGAFPLLALFLVAACARPLSTAETEFANALFGDTLDTKAVKVHAGLGLTPLPRARPPVASGAATQAVPANFCTRTPQPRRLQLPAAFVLYNSVFIRHRYYAADTFQGWPEQVPLPQALLMAHELVHVWQWQNRDLTAYRPATSAAESVAQDDPYYWQAQDHAFLSYGYEQQAAIIEDYVCNRLFAPHSPKLRELEAILHPVIPLRRFEDALAR